MSERKMRARKLRPAAVVSAVTALGVVGIIACGSNGDATLAGPDDASIGTFQDDSAAPSDDAGLEILDSSPVSYDAAWDDAAAQMIFDSGMPTCGFPTTCPQTRGIGSISGDTGNDSVSTTGSTSEWITVRATENNNSAIGHGMSITAKLTSSAGTNYDMYVYINDGSAKAECTKVAGQSSDPGSIDTASATWGEGSVANGKVDDATVTIRIQHITGPCDTIDPWKLEVTGHTQ